MLYSKLIFSSPGRTLIISLFSLVLLGSLILSSAWALKIPQSVSYMDSLFSSASAVSVTGLLTVPLEYFSTFGLIVILLLIQVGGLGLITLTVFLMSLFFEVGLGTQVMAAQLLEIDSYRKSRYMLAFIIIFSLIIELLGAIAIFFTLPTHFSLKYKLFYSCFHAISSFCSAGFFILPGGIMAYQNNIPFLIITTLLMLIGELGFIVWHDGLLYIQAYIKDKPFRFSLHTKIVISITTFLIVVSAAIMWALERDHTFASMSYPVAFTNLLFNTISYRSTGFSTINIPTVHLATLFLIMIIAFIGSSPGSTGSGIKTTTFAIFLGAIRAVIRGRTSVEIKNRTIPNDQVFKAMAVLSLSLSLLALITFLLLLTQPQWGFTDTIFQAFSSFANLGLSTALTKELSFSGKIIVLFSMLIGRIGSLTLILAFIGRQHRTEFFYPEERVLIS